jgi:16S rRNA processing protein RimM
MSGLLLVGRILGVHGLRGELKVEPLTDFPHRFQPGSELLLDGEPVRVRRSRRERNLVYVTLAGVTSRQAAGALVGRSLYVPEGSTPLGEGQYYRHDIIGLSVRDEAGDRLGEVVEILVTGANDVYIVRGERGELLLPAVDDVVKRIDLQAGEMVVELMEGLEFTPPRTQHARGRPRRR